MDYYKKKLILLLLLIKGIKKVKRLNYIKFILKRVIKLIFKSFNLFLFLFLFLFYSNIIKN
jgi:hypothetical protein